MCTHALSPAGRAPAAPPPGSGLREAPFGLDSRPVGVGGGGGVTGPRGCRHAVPAPSSSWGCGLKVQPLRCSRPGVGPAQRPAVCLPGPRAARSFCPPGAGGEVAATLPPPPRPLLD